MKKKMLEILVDENGEYTFNCEFSPIASPDPFAKREMLKAEKEIEKIVRKLIDEYIEGGPLSQVIKVLSIADIAASIQPYEQIEELWANMMFSYLPKNEKRLRRIKESKGFKVKVIEPQTFGQWGAFPMNDRMAGCEETKNLLN